MSKKLASHNDFLSPQEHERLRRYFEQHVSWIFGSQSDRWVLPLGHWNHEFLHTDPRNQEAADALLAADPKNEPIYALWQSIKQRLLPDHELVRCYANAHTYGNEGYPHYDHRYAGNCTTIVYLNPFWSPAWGGETVFINEFDEPPPPSSLSEPSVSSLATM